MTEVSAIRRRILQGTGVAALLRAATPGALATLSADGVVVGAGAAGLSSAFLAAELDADVLLLVKMPDVSGNTAISTGIYAAVDPALQSRFGIDDGIDRFIEDVMDAERRTNDIRLVETLAVRALPTLRWLEPLGMGFQDRVMQ